MSNPGTATQAYYHRYHRAPLVELLPALLRAWRWLPSIFSLLLCGCGFSYLPTEPTSEVEEMLLSETARIAGVLGVKVHGEITETATVCQQAHGAAGWYEAGVAWYYRPQIAKYVSLTPEPGKETATNVAGHEVCHAISSQHDLTHWRCMAQVASPTYDLAGAR